MEKLKKYFEFSGTINGLNYFLRNLISTIVGFFGGFSVGYGIASSSMGLVTLGFMVAAPTVWFAATTMWKRMNALYGERATLYTVLLFGAQIFSQFLDESSPISSIMTLCFFVIGLILIFSNSDIENHEG